MDEKQIMAKLAEPFLPEEIEWRVGVTNKDKTKGLPLAYITNRAIQNRLDEVFGCFGWRNEYREWKVNAQICGLSVRYNDEWITKWDGADDSNMEAVKGGLSDAMKRAAVQWGIGRYLYSLENEWVAIKPRGGSYVIADIPRLPEWALPKGYKYPAQTNPPIQSTQRPQATEQPANAGKCSICNTEITKAVETFSVKNYGKPLCRDCQAKAREGKASA